MVRVWSVGGQLRARVHPADEPLPWEPNDLIHLGDGRFVTGRVVNGEVVEIAPPPEGWVLEFSEPGVDGRFTEVRITEDRVLKRVHEEQ